MNLELRKAFFTPRNLEQRSTRGRVCRTQDGREISGYAAVFNSLSLDLGSFRERIKPGAFSDCLRSRPDVRALFNHQPNYILGRTTSGTLALEEDSTGLHFKIDPPDTQLVRDMVISPIDRGDVNQCSIGFITRDDAWSEEPDPADAKRTIAVRTLRKIDLFDVSPVTFAAYPQTSVDARDLFFPGGIPAEVRTHVPQIGEVLSVRQRAAEECQCSCLACRDGECDECSEQYCEEQRCRQHGCPIQTMELML